MVTEFEKIVKQVVEEVNKKYEQIALDEAKEEGRKEGRKEVAKNLKGLHTPEEISKITGLNIETVLEL